MSGFVLNRHGRMVFPSNIIPELDFSTLSTLEQLDRVIRRDFETKAPSGTDILEKVELGRYDSRYALLRDIALNLFWANRFAITMYDKRPTRWRDVPRTRSDVFLPVLTPWKTTSAITSRNGRTPSRMNAVRKKRSAGPGAAAATPPCDSVPAWVMPPRARRSGRPRSPR